MMMIAEPPTQTVVIEAPVRDACRIIVAAGLKLERVEPMYRPKQARIFYHSSFHSFGQLSASTTTVFAGELHTFPGVLGPAVAGRVSADPKCDFGQSRMEEPAGIQLTFHRPVLSRNRRNAAVIIEAGLGVREGLPGVFSNQAFPPILCLVKKVRGGWAGTKCQNLEQSY